ncbi:DUF2382 domain-containing protein [Coleofasciculus sp. FACHB-1120]|uniref:DUF2382 domain-containing protein n=1 Tax=Coleofasciculus sp. FACHB-1120 TaxID=2692783 RepID=UPI001683488F|nr:DUF2382 domain-containing protein [Coleofasciculus sp. FACHB-1120]MBD2741076.1 DUF2382 domain-containing protein [Coleofasciculus sp. FACHB-1120]
MVLFKLEDFDTDYQDSFGGDDVKGFDVYSDISDDKVGSVKNILVDESGRFRYLVVDTGFWVFGKQVLLPVGRSRIDYDNRRVSAVGLTKEQVENLPEFGDDLKVDYDYEEQVRGVYRSSAAEPSVETSAPINTSTPVDASAPLGAPPVQPTYAAPMTGAVPAEPSYAAYDRDRYDYQQEPSLYDMNDRDHQTLKLYEERLIANKTRRKTGEVAVGKHVETETARVSVPVDKERVIVERVTPADAGRAVTPGEAAFHEGEAARMEIYEETPNIQKEAFVREEVRIRKEVDHDTVNAEEQLRREELDVNSNDLPIRDQNIRTDRDRI